MKIALSSEALIAQIKEKETEINQLEKELKLRIRYVAMQYLKYMNLKGIQDNIGSLPKPENLTIGFNYEFDNDNIIITGRFRDEYYEESFKVPMIFLFDSEKFKAWTEDVERIHELRIGLSQHTNVEKEKKVVSQN